MIYNYREEAEVIKTLLLITPESNSKDRKALFDKYINAKYPYLAHREAPPEFDPKAVIERAVSKGPMVIQRG